MYVFRCDLHVFCFFSVCPSVRLFVCLFVCRMGRAAEPEVIDTYNLHGPTYCMIHISLKANVYNYDIT